jgi:DNA-binding LacI/PurR family transcriptional regulator
MTGLVDTTENAATLTADSQVAKACKRVVRHIHAHGLKTGAKLPTQAEFRESTEFGNATLSAAMRILVEAGVLTRKTGVGTVVADPEARVPGLWTVGLTLSEELHQAPFYSQLVAFLQAHLQKTDCRFRLYLSPGKEAGAVPFSFFPGLENDLAAGRLDALISPSIIDAASWARALALGVIPVYVGAEETLPCAVLIEQQTMVRQAVALLVRQGCRRLAVASHEHSRPGFHYYWDGFQEGLAAAGLPVTAGESVICGPVQGARGGMQIAAELLARPRSRRPDGIMVIDDRLAVGMAAAFREAGDYAPQLVVQCNQQAPLAFALPVTRFLVDVEALAVRSVELVRTRLRDAAQPERVLFVPQQLADYGI